MNTTQSWCLDTVTGWGESLRIRSRRGPTSKRQARAAGGRIFHHAGLAFCCRSRLGSNVRPHNPLPVAGSAPRTANAKNSAGSALPLREHNSQKPVLARTALANVRDGCSRLGFHVCASRLLAGAFRLLASVSSWNHRPSMVSPSFSGVQGGGMVSASAAPATARFGGLKMAALWPVMNQLALGWVRPNPILLV